MQPVQLVEQYVPEPSATVRAESQLGIGLLVI